MTLSDRLISFCKTILQAQGIIEKAKTDGHPARTVVAIFNKPTEPGTSKESKVYYLHEKAASLDFTLNLN